MSGHEGGSLCGEVRFRVSVPPLDSGHCLTGCVSAIREPRMCVGYLADCGVCRRELRLIRARHYSDWAVFPFQASCQRRT
jgi:bacterioferritin-associated ferredoxin